MTTRHVSSRGDYPFVSPLPLATQPEADGILDLYFVIQGDPTFLLPPASSLSSSSTEPGEFHEDFVQTILFEYEIVATDTIYTFHAVFNEKVYVVTFTVPHAGGIGRVSNDDGSDVDAVLIFDADFIIKVGMANPLGAIVEPARTQWHIEKLKTLSFFNIKRCNGEEDQSILVPVIPSQTSSSSMGSSAGPFDTLNLKLRDGYNVEVAYDPDSGLSFLGGDALGKGNAPDFGNTVDCESSSSAEAIEDGITTVNGVIPVAGNIPINVSPSLGKQTQPGKIEIIVKS
jgi:hypothetical protein